MYQKKRIRVAPFVNATCPLFRNHSGTPVGAPFRNHSWLGGLPFTGHAGHGSFVHRAQAESLGVHAVHAPFHALGTKAVGLPFTGHARHESFVHCTQAATLGEHAMHVPFLYCTPKPQLR